MHLSDWKNGSFELREMRVNPDLLSDDLDEDAPAVFDWLRVHTKLPWRPGPDPDGWFAIQMDRDDFHRAKPAKLSKRIRLLEFEQMLIKLRWC